MATRIAFIAASTPPAALLTRDVDRFSPKNSSSTPSLVPFERQRDDRELVLAALLLHVERVAQLFADPFRLQRIRADHDGEGRRFLDGLLDLRPERIAAAQLARIDPPVLP